jgi:hypothetical protein
MVSRNHVLRIPDYDSLFIGHHEENQLAVMQWLKKTSKFLGIVLKPALIISGIECHWLMIFDNAGEKSFYKQLYNA